MCMCDHNSTECVKASSRSSIVMPAGETRGKIANEHSGGPVAVPSPAHRRPNKPEAAVPIGK